MLHLDIHHSEIFIMNVFVHLKSVQKYNLRTPSDLEPSQGYTKDILFNAITHVGFLKLTNTEPMEKSIK